MLGLVREERLDALTKELTTYLARVDKVIEAAQQRIAGLEQELSELRAILAVATEAMPPEQEAERDRSLPVPVRAAIAARCGRGNVNRKALLEQSARIMLDDPGADARDVADTLLEGSGDFEL